jgi:hypothetical protein
MPQSAATILIGSAGYRLRHGEQYMAADCTPGAADIAAFSDLATLSRCLVSVRPSIAEIAGARGSVLVVGVGAERAVSYAQTVAVLDAAHGAGFERAAFKVWQ